MWSKGLLRSQTPYNCFVVLLVLQVYKRKTEAAKKEYLKALAAYRASQLSQVTCSERHIA